MAPTNISGTGSTSLARQINATDKILPSSTQKTTQSGQITQASQAPSNNTGKSQPPFSPRNIAEPEQITSTSQLSNGEVTIMTPEEVAAIEKNSLRTLRSTLKKVSVR